MVQQSIARLDAAFTAMSDATRRGILETLGREDASVTSLADRFAMSLTGMKKHVALLEQAGLVATEKVGRVRLCRLERQGFADVAAWIEVRRQVWTARFDALDATIESMNDTKTDRETAHGPAQD